MTVKVNFLSVDSTVAGPNLALEGWGLFLVFLANKELNRLALVLPRNRDNAAIKKALQDYQVSQPLIDFVFPNDGSTVFLDQLFTFAGDIDRNDKNSLQGLMINAPGYDPDCPDGNQTFNLLQALRNSPLQVQRK